MWKKISQRCWVSFRKRFFISFVYWINSNTVSKPYRIIRRSLRTGRFTLLECKAVSDSSVVSIAVVIDFWGFADIADTRGPFNPKGSLVLPLLYRQTCHLFVLHAIFFDETMILPYLFFIFDIQWGIFSWSFVTMLNLRIIANNFWLNTIAPIKILFSRENIKAFNS